VIKYCNVLQCIARQSMLQCVAVCCSCSVLQCIAVRCSVLQCVAVCCSVLQCIARQNMTKETYIYEKTSDVRVDLSSGLQARLITLESRGPMRLWGRVVVDWNWRGSDNITLDSDVPLAAVATSCRYIVSNVSSLLNLLYTISM